MGVSVLQSLRFSMITSALALFGLVWMSEGAIAQQEVLAENHADCIEQSNQFINDYIGNIERAYVTERTILRARSGHPEGRDQTYTFLIDGEDARHRQASGSVFSAAASNFFDTCNVAASVVIHNQPRVETDEFGRVPRPYGNFPYVDGPFWCQEDLGIYPAEGQYDPMHWGRRFCSI